MEAISLFTSLVHSTKSPRKYGDYYLDIRLNNKNKVIIGERKDVVW